MCVSINRSSTSNYSSENVSKNNSKDLPLNLQLAPDIRVPLDSMPYTTGDQMNFKSYNLPPKQIVYPNMPIYNDPNDNSPIRLTEASPNSAKIEIGKPGERAFVTIKARNEVTYNGIYETTTSKMSVDSPYLRDMARDYARDTVMENVVEPWRDTVGRTAADASLGAAVVATAVVAAKHLPDGNLKLDIPTKGVISDDNLKARLIMGFGDGKNLKPTGVEIKDSFEYKDQKIDIKASVRKDAKVDDILGNRHEGVTKAEIEAVITDIDRTETSGVLSMRIGHDKISGTSAGLYYSKRF